MFKYFQVNLLVLQFDMIVNREILKYTESYFMGWDTQYKNLKSVNVNF